MAANNYDLTPVMAEYFDVHMFCPLLDFLRELDLYDGKLITQEKIKTLSRTNLIDLVEEEYARYPDDKQLQKELAEKAPIFESRRDAIFDKIDHEPESVQLVSEFFANTELIAEIKDTPNFNIQYLSINHGISAEALETYYKFSKFKYECGMYADAEAMLSNYLLVQQSPSSSVTGALWGRLACHILQAKWDQALSNVASVKESIEVRNISPMDQLRQRAWLLHWGLFVHRDFDALADFFSERSYLQTLENLCPWLLRYYAAFVVLSPSRRKTMLRDVLNEIQNMSYQYSDPITEFLLSLYTEFDFDEAQLKLNECQALMKHDFFLQAHADKFMHEARQLICEMYCTINHHVDLVFLSEKLQLSEEEAERWMVDMVRSATSGPTHDAKIDSACKKVIMSTPSRVAHSTVMEKSKELTVRSTILNQNLTSILHDQQHLIKARRNQA